MLVTHLLGSEAEVLHLLLGEAPHRDRPAEFVTRAESVAELLELVNAADILLDRAKAGVSGSRLIEHASRGDKAPESRLAWLIWNAAHAREHLGQVSQLRHLWLSKVKS